MFELRRLVPGLACCAVLLAMAPGCAAADGPSPELLSRCFEMNRLWTRYETEHCPNQTGQRAQAEWALYRCLQGDFDRGLSELERLLRRDLISAPDRPASFRPKLWEADRQP
jgi:hypothetical protein